MRKKGASSLSRVYEILEGTDEDFLVFKQTIDNLGPTSVSPFGFLLLGCSSIASDDILVKFQGDTPVEDKK